VALLSRPFFVDEQEVFISASIGISIYPADGKDSDTLLRNADVAMYRAKSQGRSNYQFYTPALTTQVQERLTIETYLRQALKKNELLLHYQPQYSLETQQIIGVEALLRWDQNGTNRVHWRVGIEDRLSATQSMAGCGVRTGTNGRQSVGAAVLETGAGESGAKYAD